MKLYKSFVLLLLFFLTTLAFPWGSELCQGCRIDSSALAGPIYTWPNSTMLQQMISTNGTFLFQDDVNLYPQYSNGIKLEIRTQSKSPLRLAYDVNNYVDFSIGAGGALTINATGGMVISQNGNVVIKNGNVGIGAIIPVATLHVSSNVAGTPIMQIGNAVVPNALVVSTNGNVGIGTTSPGVKLDVTGTVSASALVVNGTATYKLVNKTTNYTASDESIILVNASAGNVTINLPAAAGVLGRVYQIKKTDNSFNRVSIVGYGSETIDSSTFVTMDNKYASYTVLSDGSNWWTTSYVAGIPRIDFIASGGNKVEDISGYRIHTFTSSGTFIVTQGGNVDYLVVAGGGGGVGYGGGGAGGVRQGRLSLSAGSKTVTIGLGGLGQGATAASGDGNGSIFDTISASGGGAGGEQSATGRAGGSGGGGSHASAAGLGNAGAYSPVEGYGGGLGFDGAGSFDRGGSGGGASEAGHAATSITSAVGGNGISSTISGVSVTYGGGGGGGFYEGAGGAGGSGGGGQGGNRAIGQVAGAANTGGGGGGAGEGGYAGANGGSGIVIIRYPITQ